MAIELRRHKKNKEIYVLARENFITDERIIERFVTGDLLALASEKMFTEALEKEKKIVEKQKSPKDTQLEAGACKKDVENSQDYSKTDVLDTNSAVNSQIDSKTSVDVKVQIDKPTNNKIIVDKEELWHKVQGKLEKELKKFKDGDSRHVVEKLILLSKEDTLLAQNILLPHKSYQKAFAYFFGKSRTVGFKTKVDKVGEAVYLDNDKAVELSIEYFLLDDEEEERKKEEQRKERLEENKKKKMDKKTEVKDEITEAKKPEEKKAEEGQLSIFDMMAS